MSAWAYDVRILQGQATRSLESFWPANNGVAMAAFERLNAVIILIRGNYSDVAFWAETAIAMAGTATEQLVSLQPLTLEKRFVFCIFSATVISRRHISLIGFLFVAFDLIPSLTSCRRVHESYRNGC